MAIKLTSAVDGAVVRSPVQFAFRNMHLTAHERVAASIGQLTETDSVSPLAAEQIEICVKNWAAGDNNSGTVSWIKKVCRSSAGTWRGVPMICCVIANCTANDGFK